MKKMNPFFMLIVLLAVLQSCGSSNANHTSQEQETNKTTSAMQDSKTATNANEEMASEKCEFIFPSGLKNELKSDAVKLSLPVQTDSACMMSFENKSTKAALTLIAEKHTDLALLERKVQAFEYMPNTRGKIDAGDAGTLYRQTDKHSDIITAVFRIGPYGCSITSTMKTGEPASNGVLFDEDKITELAIAWGNQLKQLLQ
jgi:hypothetical protein